MKYTLEINQLTLPILIGVEQEERVIRQDISFYISINFENMPKSCKTDDISDAICYANFVEKIEEFCLNKEFHLIEHLGSSLHQYLKTALLSTNDKLYLKVCKTPPIEKVLGNCCFIIED